MKHSSLIRQANEFADFQLLNREKITTRLENLRRMSAEAVESIRKRADEDILAMNTLFMKLMNEEQEALEAIDATLSSDEED